jgi:ATP-dependent helicase Lhr and Lhr-like helicase
MRYGFRMPRAPSARSTKRKGTAAEQAGAIVPPRPALPADPLGPFSQVTRDWFIESFAAPTRVQAMGWARIASGEHTLMLAPTGSGKTLAAFLACLDRLTSRPPVPSSDGLIGTRVLYVSPIKALAYDVERNLKAPLIGLERVAAARDQPLHVPGIDVRTGDTSPADRRRQLRHPGEILITTPESLYLMLGSAARANLASVETVIIDEIHAVAPTKRGVHLALSLERLSALCAAAGNAEPQRIGLSATQRPLEEIARYLGGDRPVAIVDAGELPQLDLEIIVPVADMSAPPPLPPGSAGTSLTDTLGDSRGMWPYIYPKLLELVLAHRSTILFVNSRRLAERLATQLTELARLGGACPPDVELVRAHHGSVARLQRLGIEEDLKAGRLRAITATSSLELGIDMGAVDLVVQIESPGAVARGLQRIGRAGHQVGAVSRGRIVPKFRGDLLEAAVCARGMLDGKVESVRLPENCLDVLAQQIVAMCSTQPWKVDELERVITRAASYRGLGRAALTAVLDMLAGRYPSDELADLRPRLTWDRTNDVLTARPGARLLSVVNAGTIPDRGLYPVHLGEGGPRVGELDEEMVHESRRGETFLLGATTWRVEDITRDRVIVSPAPGEPGKMPFWRGDGPVRPVELGRMVGAFTRHVDELLGRHAPEAVTAMLRESHRLDAFAAQNLLAYIQSQREAAATVPTDRTIVVERFRDELGDWRVCILSPLGGRVHAPWAHVLGRRLEDRLGYPVHALYTDDGIALRFADGDELPELAELFPAADEIEELVVSELARSARFAGVFRENAARALLLPRRRPGQRTPLWIQRQKSQQLMGVALRFPSFPIVLETYRECLRDIFDMPALRELLGAVERREIAVEEVTLDRSSPFASSLVFDYVASFLYEGDAPLAERKAQALTLDRGLLRELLGEGELRELLDPIAIEEVEDELAGRTEARRARSPEQLADLLRRVGDLELAELQARSGPELGDVAAALAQLASARQVVAVRLGGADRWIAVEDAARYRDGLGTLLQPGLPAALLGPTEGALTSLFARYARVRGPFTLDEVAARWALPRGAVATLADAAVGSGALVRGALRPGVITISGQVELCDAEVLRRLRRRTLARLRSQVAPVEAAAMGRFLPQWHGIGNARRGPTALREALAQLEGQSLSFGELEAKFLPARVLDFSPRMLDELGAMGEWVWVGRGASGPSDGKVAIVRRQRAPLLIQAGALPAGASELQQQIVAHLLAAGASFLVALEMAVPEGSRGQLREALWDLVWAGVITNDTFAPLRSLKSKTGKAEPARRASSPGGRGLRGRGGYSTPHASFGGRWSLVSSLLLTSQPPSGTQRLHALAVSLLDRWGVVSREAALAEAVPGGFAALVPVLDGMEEAGTVRRGYFVVGLSGRQYAWAGAVDRLRAETPARTVTVLGAGDPANPYGAILAWPQVHGEARAGRRVGASLVLVDGAPVLHVEPRGGKVLTFAAASEADVELAIGQGLRGMSGVARRTLVVESVDGAPALMSRWAQAFDYAGFRRDYRGFVAVPEWERKAMAGGNGATSAAMPKPLPIPAGMGADADADADSDSDSDSDSDADADPDSDADADADPDPDPDPDSDPDPDPDPELVIEPVLDPNSDLDPEARRVAAKLLATPPPRAPRPPSARKARAPLPPAPAPDPDPDLDDGGEDL